MIPPVSSGKSSYLELCPKEVAQSQSTEYIVYDMEWTDRDLTMLNM